MTKTELLKAQAAAGKMAFRANEAVQSNPHIGIDDDRARAWFLGWLDECLAWGLEQGLRGPIDFGE